MTKEGNKRMIQEWLWSMNMRREMAKKKAPPEVIGKCGKCGGDIIIYDVHDHNAFAPHIDRYVECEGCKKLLSHATIMPGDHFPVSMSIKLSDVKEEGVR